MPLKIWKHCALALLALVGSIAQAQNILILTTGAKDERTTDAENNYMSFVVDEYAKPFVFADFAGPSPSTLPCNNVTRTGQDPVTGATKSVTCNQTQLVDGQPMPANFFDAGYDLLVVASAYSTIDSGDWDTIQKAVESRKVRGVVLYIDSVNKANATLIPGLLNASMGSSVGEGTSYGDGNFYFPINTTARAASYFSGLDTLELNTGFSVYSGVPANLALYTGGAASPPIPAGTLTEAAAVFIPQADSFKGLGACVFGIPDIGWGYSGTGHNIGKLGAAFLAVFNDANGPCATPLASPPVLKITKAITKPNPATTPANGATVSYEVNVSNTSPTALALNVGVTDNAPAGMTLGLWKCTQVQPATPTGLCPTGLQAGNLSTSIPSLPAGALLRFTVDATVVDNQQDLTNTATLTLPAGATCDGGASPCAASVTLPAQPPVTSPTPAPVPTLSQWAGIVLTLVMGCFGLFALRRREVFIR